MRLGIPARGQHKRLLLGGEAFHQNGYAVLAERNRAKVKLAGVVTARRLSPVGTRRAQRHLRALYRTVLWIVNQSVD